MGVFHVGSIAGAVVILAVCHARMASLPRWWRFWLDLAAVGVVLVGLIVLFHSVGGAG